MAFFNPYTVLWLVIWSMALFVIAPHLEVVCKPAARTVRLGSFALLVEPIAAFAMPFLHFGDLYAYLGLLSDLCRTLFWGSFALAAWQIVQAAPKKGELR